MPFAIESTPDYTFRRSRSSDSTDSQFVPQPTEAVGGNPGIPGNPANRTIRHTGTSASLAASGLGAITGVTTETSMGGARTVYIIPATHNMVIEGTLTINTETEAIRFERILPNNRWYPTLLIGTGDLNSHTGVAGELILGTQYGTSGIYTDNVGLEFTGNNTIWVNHSFAPQQITWEGERSGAVIQLSSNGTLTQNGGRITGKVTLGISDGATINNDYDSKLLIYDEGQAAGEEFVVRLFGGTYNLTDYTIQGGSMTMAEGSAGSTFALSRVAGGVGYWHQTNAVLDLTSAATIQNTVTTVRNVSLLNNVVDFAPFNLNSNTTGTCCRIQNCVQGTDINVNGGETVNTQQNAGYTLFTREIATNIRQLADLTQTAQGTLWCRDTNNAAMTGVRSGRDPSTKVTGLSDITDLTYRASFNGTDLTNWTAGGSTSAATIINGLGDTEVVTGIHTLQRGTARVRGTQDTGIWAKDLRTVGGTPGNDTMQFHLWSYEHNYDTLTPSLAGTPDAFTIERNLIADPNVSEARADIATRNTSVGSGLGITDATAGGTNLGLTSSITLDNLYDLVKYRKEVDATVIEQPSVSTMAVSSDGSTITLDTTRRNLVGTGVISIGTRHTGLSTTGTVSMAQLSLNTGTLIANSITNPTLFTAEPDNTQTTNSFSQMAIGGTITVNTGATNQYIVFDRCTVAAGQSITINRGTGTGTVFVSGLPSGNGVTYGANVQAAPVTYYTLTNDLSNTIYYAYGTDTSGTLGTVTTGTLAAGGELEFTSQTFASGTNLRMRLSAEGFDEAPTQDALLNFVSTTINVEANASTFLTASGAYGIVAGQTTPADNGRSIDLLTAAISSGSVTHNSVSYDIPSGSNINTTGTRLGVVVGLNTIQVDLGDAASVKYVYELKDSVNYARVCLVNNTRNITGAADSTTPLMDDNLLIFLPRTFIGQFLTNVTGSPQAGTPGAVIAEIGAERSGLLNDNTTNVSVVITNRPRTQGISSGALSSQIDRAVAAIDAEGVEVRDHVTSQVETLY